MKHRPTEILLVALAIGLSGSPGRSAETPPPPTLSEVLDASAASDWRPLDPSRTLYMELADGAEIVIALAPAFAPRHVANIEALVAERYYDGLAVTRSQENYVVQWGDPTPEGEERRSLGRAKVSLAPELARPVGELAVTRLEDADPYADIVGFAEGLPVAMDPKADLVWLAHCHGMVGVGRDVAPDSGNGAELYVVIGHAPRHLDRNVTLVGRVVAGIEHLSTLPRGTGALGFYENPADYVTVRSTRLGSELPAAERAPLELLRTDSETFRRVIASRRSRSESWFLQPTGHIGLCNVPLPVRERPGGTMMG